MTAGGRNGYPTKLRTRAARMMKDGYTSGQVAAKLGVSQTFVRRWANEKEHEKPASVPEAILMLHAWPSGQAIFMLDGDELTEG